LIDRFDCTINEFAVGPFYDLRITELGLVKWN